MNSKWLFDYKHIKKEKFYSMEPRIPKEMYWLSLGAFYLFSKMAFNKAKRKWQRIFNQSNRRYNILENGSGSHPSDRREMDSISLCSRISNLWLIFSDYEQAFWGVNNIGKMQRNNRHEQTFFFGPKGFRRRFIVKLKQRDQWNFDPLIETISHN